MTVDRTMLQRLEVLQSSRPLEVPPTCHGVVTGLPEVPPNGLFESIDTADAEQLRELLGTARFWISLLEGERCDAIEEVAKHKRRYQQALRATDVKATELREAEGEKKRLLSEIKWLQESRDKAICERHLLREDASRLTEEKQDDTAKAGSMGAEMDALREERADLEQQLVRVKIRSVESLQKADSQEMLIEYYEDQLRALNPHFEPVAPETIGQWIRNRLDGCDAESNGSREEHKEERSAKNIARGFQSLWKGVAGRGKWKKKHRHHKDDDGVKVRENDEPAMSPSHHTPAPSPNQSPRTRGRTPETPSIPPLADPPAMPNLRGRQQASPGASRTPTPGEETFRREENSPSSSRVSSSPQRAKKRWEMRAEMRDEDDI